MEAKVKEAMAQVHLLLERADQLEDQCKCADIDAKNKDCEVCRKIEAIYQEVDSWCEQLEKEVNE